MSDNVIPLPTSGPVTWRWSHVPCRTCGAEIGQRCTSATGRATQAHTPRMADWWEAAQRWRKRQCQ